MLFSYPWSFFEFFLGKYKKSLAKNVLVNEKNEKSFENM